MPTPDQLLDLARRCEAAAGVDVEIDHALTLLFWGDQEGISAGSAIRYGKWESYTGSLDACQALHERLLPGWVWFGGNLHGLNHGFSFTITPLPFPDAPHAKGFGKTSALAWLAAILRALAAQPPT